MAKERNERVATIIKEIVASYIQREANPNPLITVTRVDLARDGKNATVCITTIPDSGEKDALIFLKRHGREIRHTLMQKSRIGTVPHLAFIVDAGERHRQHIDTIMRDVEKGR